MGPNRRDEAWAWAAVRFGWTPSEYEQLTPAQIVLLAKADEERTVQLATLVRDATANAIANAFRKKGERDVPLFRRRSHGVELTRDQAMGKMHGIMRAMGGA